MKQHAIIIAEAGVNHNGDPDIARELVRKAAAAGADYVKFQTFDAAKLVAASPRLISASISAKERTDD